ncbi:MAG: AmmeMemoRadiSam system protein A [Nanoarchaeota archaeon]
MNAEDGQRLLKLARESIQTYFSDSEPDTKSVEHLTQKRGLFCTLHKKGQLRGCIGQPLPIMPLYKAVIDAARSAAFKDPRFPPLKEEELKELHLELSILTEPQKIEANAVEEYKEKIEVGRHGLIIKHPQGSGLLLPQVPKEQGWGCEEYLKHICLKAGLPPTALNDKETELYCFEAQVFSE